MCKLITKTKFKTKTVYKLVLKYNGEFYSYYTGYKMHLGKIQESWCAPEIDVDWNDYSDDVLYNNLMLGKTSGFSEKLWAIKLKDTSRKYENFNLKDIERVILKIQLGGEIWKGNGSRISNYIPDNIVIYAGSEILSMSEIKG